LSEPIISVRGLSKAYNIYERPRDIVLEAIFGGARHDVFWALRDISFEIAEGQRVGIVGPNGAGKSTLLKIITGNLQQTSGSVAVRGTVSAMLSLTSFLDVDQTGLDNIRFNLLVSGARRAEIPRLTEEIVDFTELGAFIRSPVRTYSSGMHTRLAFAISTAITPDILVIDEILGAGDAYFVGKATKRMIDLCDEGRGLLFVSHSISAVQMLCDTAIWMDGGSIREIGPVDQVARRYEADFRAQEDEKTRSGNRERRDRLVGHVAPEEFSRAEIVRFRLTGDARGVHRQHYIRRVVVEVADDAIEVPLELTDIDEPGVEAALDVLASEWGRPHTRRGSEARALAPSSARLRGGHLLVRRPELAAGADVRLRIESAGGEDSETLRAQFVNLERGEWDDLETLERVELGDGWVATTFGGRVEVVEKEAREHALERLLATERPDVELRGTALFVGGERDSYVHEQEPFEVAVSFRANRKVPLLDVGLRFMRSDGVYAFWQSSGETGGNLRDVDGERTVRFNFDPNLFGAGEYAIAVYLANGYDPETNYPYSEVFDRRVNELRLTVLPKHREIDFGVLNQKVAVTVEDGALDVETIDQVRVAREA
jgi:lipopolysaccharide transport system ATP-binding protein